MNILAYLFKKVYAFDFTIKGTKFINTLLNNINQIGGIYMRLIPWKSKNYLDEVPLSPPTESQRKYYQYFYNELQVGNTVKINQYTNYLDCYLSNCVKNFIESKDFNQLIEDTQKLEDVYINNGFGFFSIKILRLRSNAIEYLDNKNTAREYYLSEFSNKNTLGRTLTEISLFFAFFKPDYKCELKAEDVHLAANTGNYLTDFGMEHYENMKPIINNELYLYQKEHGENFLYSIFKDFLFNKKVTLFSTTPYSTEKDVLHSKITATHDIASIPLKEFFRHCENVYRESISIPRIGEGWLSETLLYRRIQAAFPTLEVIHHGRPNFLKPQHLDVFIPELKLGIEYQGAQHFNSVEFFGGEEGLIRTKERDRVKRKKMKDNCHDLIEVFPNYLLDDILNQIVNIGIKHNKKLYVDKINLDSFRSTGELMYEKNNFKNGKNKL